MKPTARTLTRLRVTDDRGFEKTVLIDKDVFPIGREAAGGMTLPDEQSSAIAPQHALVIRDGDTLVLKDQSGPRGTRVNGRPIRSTVLKHGDQITLGTSTLRVQFLVEGTRAADFEAERVRRMLDLLRQVHSAHDEKEIATRMAAGITGLIGASWAAIALRDSAGQLAIVAALDRSGALPAAPSGIAMHVAGTARSYFHPVRLCVPICADADADCQQNDSGGALLGVIDAGPTGTSPYKPVDMHWLEALAAHASVALNNARRLREASLSRVQAEAATR